MYSDIWKTHPSSAKKVAPSFLSLLPIYHYFSYLQLDTLTASKGEIWDSFSCWVNFLGGNLPCHFSITRISFDTGVPGWATQRMSGYLKFFLSAVICNLKNQQCRARSCWFCSPLRRISSQQMP